LRASGRLGLLFDLDGVLWDTSRVHEQAFAEVGRWHRLDPVPYERLAGRPTPEAWRLVLEANGRPAEPDFVAAITSEKQELARRPLRSNPPLGGELDLIASLPRSGLALGLVTGASAATASVFLAASGLHFEVVITGESVQEGKPSPAPYLAAASSLQLDPDSCWVLEDSAQGIESATLAGTRCVHLTANGRTCKDIHPKVVTCVRTIAEFLTAVGVPVRG
jgi:mannitol-1-/sugar-/sorbitol-6-phosphatase